MPGVPIHIDGITKRHGAATVVRDVSLHVSAGEFVALLGPSGSGKSTILMGVAGFARPTSGAIWIDGKDVTDLPPRQRNIGMVFQRYALFPHMTVAQNIAFPLVQRGIGRAEVDHRIKDMVQLVGLQGLEGRSALQLSGGQQQRVALARALVFRPPVLLMDEPLGALDKKMREHLQVEIKDIQRITGTTVLFVTHDQSEALGMADRLLVLNHGRVEQVGTPEELYEAPANAFVADFIGEANLLPGVAVGGDRGACKVRLNGGSETAGTAAGARIGIGDAVQIVVRPSKVRLAEASGAGLSGEVLSTSYFGDSVSIRLRLAGGQVLTAKEPASSRWAPGQKLAASWEDRDARIFPQEDVDQHRRSG